MPRNTSAHASRRRVLFGTAGLATVALAGCADEEDPDPEADDDGAEADDSDDDGASPTAASVTLLVEGVGGHDHDDDHHDDHDHDDHSDDYHDDYGDDHHDDYHDDHGDDHHDDDHHDDHGGDHHDDDHHDDHGDDHHDDHDGELSEDEIDHACGHLEFDDPEPLAGGSSVDDAPVISSTHEPYDVSIEGDSTFVVFEADDDDGDDHHDDHSDDHHDDHGDEHHDDHGDEHHDDHGDEHHDDHGDEHHDDHDDHDHDHGDGDIFGFFTTNGTASIHEGHVLHEEDAVETCAEIDRYVVAEADHGRVVVELIPDE
ncbi:hypothetical protein [Halorubrum vacuolatum]|uniref:Zinc transport system substrate-binding protein n=1 Tax=Halorubrum vacuolatum TaxID=63740 RepID=A0A238UNG1_HALVU|nr:hypothetical protein [Halorubrum vacuolatum]SNR23137.1 hypothetical protein SAMN06264855_10166 [Halorubrum vacuolatum]